MLVFFLSGCLDPISNRLFFEDQEFLDALPSAEHQRVHYAATKAEADAEADEDDTTDDVPLEAPEGAPDLLVLTVASVNGVNAMVDALLGLVDGLQSIPPSLRTDDERTWGPYPYDAAPDYDIRVVSERRGVGEFTWSFDTAPKGSDDWTTFFAGVHDAGVTVKDGLGTFTFDGLALEAVSGGGDTPFFLGADYDNREGSTVAFRIWSAKADSAGAPLATYGYAIDEAAAGSFTFETDIADFVEGAAYEHYEVTTQWVPDIGGRGDAAVSGGDLVPWIGNESVRFTQCWLPDGTLVYQSDDHGFGKTVGTESSCTVP